MAHINLLPWREKLRKQRLRDFGLMALGALVLSVAAMGYWHWFNQGMIDNQRDRNRFLEREIAKVKVSGNWISEDGANLLAAAKAGIGIAQLPDFYTSEAVAKGELVALDPQGVAVLEGLDGGVEGIGHVAVDSAERVYITDPEGYRVLIFSSDGTYIGRFGTFGAGTTNFGLPNGIAIDKEDNIYIADSGNNRILKFASPFAPGTQPEAESLPVGENKSYPADSE